MARYRVAVGAALGPPQRPVERFLDDLGHGMFEALRFRIGGDPVEPEDVRQPALHDPMSADASPRAVSSISLRALSRSIPSRVMRRSATVTVGRLTESQSARRALRTTSPSARM